MPGDTLTIFSSLPLQGPEARALAEHHQRREARAAARRAARRATSRSTSPSRDDSTAGDARAGLEPGQDRRERPQGGRRTPARSPTSATSTPARRRSRSRSRTRPGFAQVSPGSTAVGLTKLVPGAEKGEPDKYYPSGERTFARVVPADDVAGLGGGRLGTSSSARARSSCSATAASRATGSPSCSASRPRKQRTQVVGSDRDGPARQRLPRPGREDRQGRTPTSSTSAAASTATRVRLWQDLHAALPEARADGFRTSCWCPDFYAASAAPSARHVPHLGRAGPAPAAGRAGKRFVRDYRREFGEPPDPYAAYGYASMSLLLDAIERAGRRGDERDDVIDETLRHERLRSPVGTFSIDDNGDTSLERDRRLPDPQRQAGVRAAAQRAEPSGVAALSASRRAAVERRASSAPARRACSARAMPARRASSPTAAATASATRRSNTLGMMYSSDSSLVGDHVGDRRGGRQLHLLGDLGGARRRARRGRGRGSTARC